MTNNRPHILHIITDQQSADALSCAGNSWVSTPNMDALAARGIRFERAYSPHPLCVPARASMLTGLPSVLTEKRISTTERRSWTDKEIQAGSIGWTLKQAGYDVPYIGKWHVADIGDPPDHGFRCYNGDAGYYCGQADVVLAGARQFFTERDAEKPFYMTASLIQPHGICYWGRYMPPNSWQPQSTPWPEGDDPWDKKYTGDGYPFPVPEKTLPKFIEEHCPPLPENFEIAADEPEILQSYRDVDELGFVFPKTGGASRGLSEEQCWRLYRWTYYRLCEQLDKQIGDLLALLDEYHLGGNTIILFTSDHGEALGAHQLRFKNELYEEPARVPFFLIDPDHIPKNAVNAQAIVNQGLDIFPTICDYAQIDIPKFCTGSSLRPFIHGTPPYWRDHTVVECRVGRAVIGGRWKYCSYTNSPKHPEQLFDLEHDPYEQKNRAKDPAYADILAQQRQYLSDWLQSIGNPDLPWH